MSDNKKNDLQSKYKLENKIPARSDVDPKNKWRVEDLFASDDLWRKELEAVKIKAAEIPSFSGKLNSAENTLACLDAVSRVNERAERLYCYAQMKFHEDSTNPVYQELSSKMESEIVSITSAQAFINSELLTLDENALLGFIDKEPKLKVYARYIENILRSKEHTLSPKEEKLLAQAAELASSPQNIFTMLNEADIKFDDIEDENGNLLELTKGKYVSFLESSDRTLRKNAFKSLYKSYLAQKNTIAAAYSANVAADVFFANARGYGSSLEAALDDDNIPVSVYANLTDTVRKNIGLMRRYVRLRKKLLGVDELHTYDLYAPLVPKNDMKITYDEAKSIVVKALAPMGEEYINGLKEGLEGGWIDVYENIGKRSGAYSWGAYPGHPFVLLNHKDNINGLFTLAHEMGHAMHSYYTWKTMPYIYSGHKIFVAEVASTCNEALLTEYLLNDTDDKETLKFIINHNLEQFRGTLFRQTMFAEFEKICHEKVENGQSLTAQNMTDEYLRLNKFYFGDDITIDEEIGIEWARIPHFYNSFYVYQYATGYSAALALSNAILTEGKPAVERYINFLKKGNSEYSIDLLKGAGVDMTTPLAIENAMKIFEKLLDKMENLCL